MDQQPQRDVSALPHEGPAPPFHRRHALLLRRRPEGAGILQARQAAVRGGPTYRPTCSSRAAWSVTSQAATTPEAATASRPWRSSAPRAGWCCVRRVRGLEFYPRGSRQVETHAYLGDMMGFGETFKSRITRWIDQNADGAATRRDRRLRRRCAQGTAGDRGRHRVLGDRPGDRRGTAMKTGSELGPLRGTQHEGRLRGHSSSAGYDGIELSAIDGMSEHLVLDRWRRSRPRDSRPLSEEYRLELTGHRAALPRPGEDGPGLRGRLGSGHPRRQLRPRRQDGR